MKCSKMSTPCCSRPRMKESPLLSSEASYWHVTGFFCEQNLRFLYWPYWNYMGGRSHRCQQKCPLAPSPSFDDAFRES
ncbi:uncharacterized protein CDAR_59681 [Caerostris darwini]|uniref:Uncharacterized protein n=1 Tax=Caerostris darwini TaxID=1538125 RepID=A0AAV4X2I2_9ARAC|nr:uncharacterized protein CDAR_59681 [Caerostris darwini]